MPKISPHAIVEQGAQLAADVQVGPFSYIGPKVKIGPGCIIDNNVTVTGLTQLGERNHVFPMAVIGAAGEAGAAGKVVIGDANSIREHVTIYGGKSKPTTLGHDNLVMIDCQIGAGAVIGDHCIFANCTQVGPEARIEDYLHTSSFIAIEGGARVGAYTFIAAFAGIDRDAPPFAMVQGFPFRVRSVNAHKLKRCGFGDEDIQALKDAFREIFNGDQPNAQVVDEYAARSDLNAHVRRLVESLQASKKGGRR